MTVLVAGSHLLQRSPKSCLTVRKSRRGQLVKYNRLQMGACMQRLMVPGQFVTCNWACDWGIQHGSVPLSHRLPCDNVPVRPKRRVRFDLKDGSESQHDQENLASQ
ncbi:hypothetical protein WJX79_008043 [Trebouxia sp. C0005]